MDQLCYGNGSAAASVYELCLKLSDHVRTTEA